MPRKASKKTLRKKCDTLWSNIVRRIGHCERCGKRGKLEAHHLIKREHMSFRYDVNNGVCLCTECHKFGNLAAHASTAGASVFLDWLKEHKPATWEWLEEHKRDPVVPNISKEDWYYDRLAELQDMDVQF